MPRLGGPARQPIAGGRWVCSDASTSDDTSATGYAVSAGKPVRGSLEGVAKPKYLERSRLLGPASRRTTANLLTLEVRKGETPRRRPASRRPRRSGRVARLVRAPARLATGRDEKGTCPETGVEHCHVSTRECLGLPGLELLAKVLGFWGCHWPLA